MPEVSNRRKGLFIDKKFQSKFIAVGLTTVVALSIGFLILWFSSNAGRPSAEQLGSGGGTGFTLGLFLLMVFILVLVIVTIAYGLRFSHRIIGPTFAFNRHMNWIREGNYTADLKLREGDEFISLSETFNSMQSALRRRAREDLETLQRLHALVEELNGAAKTGSFDAASAQSAFDAVKKDLAELKKRQEGVLAG